MTGEGISMKNLRVWIYVLILAVVLPGVILKLYPQKTNNEYIPKEPVEEVISISLLQEDGTASQVELETYVLGVVTAEMPVDFDIEALKAQAVLARTYALKRSTAADKHPEGALCTVSSCCQAYSTQSADSKVHEAVEATEGLVLSYGGSFIEATYFSCSGGFTEDAAAVWGADVPYLQAVASPGEENTKHFVTTTKLPVSDFSGRLGVNLSDGGIGQPVYTAGGGIQTINIGGKDFTGVQLRSLLGLKSTAIQMSVVGDQVVITTKGYGHRVGMSQYGADAMAVAGSTYEQILAHYYPGTALCSYRDLTKGN